MRKLALLLALLSGMVIAGPRDVLHLYNWSGSLSSATIKRFERQCDCRVVQDFYGDNEEMLAKLASGAKGYDMVFPSSFVVDSMTRQRLLQPLDHGKLPNLKNLNPAYLNPAYDPGNRYTVPTVLSLTNVGYNVEQLKKRGIDPGSWSVIFDPAVLGRIKGRVTVLDSSREVFAAALMYLGLDPNSSNPADYQKARDVIRKARPYWATFSNASYLKELAIGNIWASLGYSSDMFQAIQDAHAARRQFTLANAVQREGNELGVDTMAILRQARRPDLAHQFINFMLEGRNAAELTNLNGAINPVQTAAAHFRLDLRHNPVLNPGPDTVRKWTVLRELTPAERRMLSRLWTEVKLGR